MKKSVKIIKIIMLALALLTLATSLSKVLAEETGNVTALPEVSPIDPNIILKPIFTPPVDLVIQDYVRIAFLPQADYLIWDDYGGWWYDAEKTSDNFDDDDMCWAASDSNILEYTGWGMVSADRDGYTLGFRDTDEIFNHFLDHWQDNGGWMYYGFDWWFTGTSDYDHRVDVAGGGDFWTGYDAANYYHEEDDDTNTVQALTGWLDAGYPVSIGIRPEGDTGGHAITVWGYRFDSNFDRINGAEHYYAGLWVTDSDDNKAMMTDDPPENTLRLYNLDYDDVNDRWVLTDYAGGWWIDLACAFEPRPGTRPVAAVSSPFISASENTPITLDASASTFAPGFLGRYRWDFDGDNQWDTEWSFNPVITHTPADNNDGIVLLEVFDGVFKDVAEVPVSIVNSPPIVEVYWDTTVDIDEEVDFMSIVLDAPADEHTYEWDFGDGNTSPLTNPTHAYTASGVYTVTLTVTDDDDGVGQDSVTVTVINIPPVVDLGEDVATDEQMAVTFRATIDGITDFTPYEIMWDFDGVPVESVYPGFATKVYGWDDQGIYTVTIYVSDGEYTVSDSVTVTVLNRAPLLSYIAGKTVDEGEEFTLSIYVSDTPADTITINWDMDDGTVFHDTDAAITYTYTKAGTYNAKITASDEDGGVKEATIKVTVNDIIPEIDTGEDIVINEGENAVFQATVNGYPDDIASMFWSFDRTTISGSVASHLYPDNGVYEASFQVTDDDGHTVIDSVQVTVNNVAPTVSLGEDISVAEGEAFTLDAIVSDPGADTYTIAWDYGIAKLVSIGGDQIGLIYGDNSVFTVTATVTDDDGSVGTASVTITVENVKPAIEYFSFVPADSGYLLPKYEAAFFAGGFSDAGWLDGFTAVINYGDGTSETLGMGVENEYPYASGLIITSGHIYQLSGEYKVTMTITDDDGASSSLSTSVKVVKPEEIVKDIKSITDQIGDEAFAMNPDKMRNALSNMLDALAKQLSAEEYDEAISKMMSIREKADGIGQDWIKDPNTIELICYKSDFVIEYLQSIS